MYTVYFTLLLVAGRMQKCVLNRRDVSNNIECVTCCGLSLLLIGLKCITNVEGVKQNGSIEYAIFFYILGYRIDFNTFVLVFVA